MRPDRSQSDGVGKDRHWWNYIVFMDEVRIELYTDLATAAENKALSRAPMQLGQCSLDAANACWGTVQGAGTMVVSSNSAAPKDK